MHVAYQILLSDMLANVRKLENQSFKCQLAKQIFISEALPYKNRLANVQMSTTEKKEVRRTCIYIFISDSTLKEFFYIFCHVVCKVRRRIFINSCLMQPVLGQGVKIEK